jgi:predicted nucleotidyltransferase
MKLSVEQMEEVVAVLRQMGARRVLLFGSAVTSPASAQDVDVAVEGIPLRGLLEADARVHDILKMPTDLISREEMPAFFDLIRPTAKVLYEQPAAS